MKLKLSFVALLAGAALALSGCGDTPVPEGTDVPDPGTPTDPVAVAFDTSISGIELGMTEAQVIAQLDALGASYDREAGERYKEDIDGLVEQLSFTTSELSIGLVEDAVIYVFTSSPSAETSRGIRVGDAESQVIDAYGEGSSTGMVSDTEVGTEYFDANTFMQFTINNDGVVTEWGIKTETWAQAN
jgi:hypothetical protein